MNQTNSLGAALISSRLAIVGMHTFAQLGLTPEEVRIFLTIKERSDWPARMQHLLPDFAEQDIDEEEL